jgi:hypothetical protein
MAPPAVQKVTAVQPNIESVNDAGVYEVFIRQLTKDGSGWEDGPDKWLEVPPQRVTPPERRPICPLGSRAGSLDTCI